MQINRLFEIVYLLMERGSVTAGELAERFEISTRTVYRDIDALSGAGIPVYASRGKGGGIRLLPDFVLNKSLLTGAEQDEILFALQSLKATSASQTGEVFSRLSGLFRKETVDWIDVDFSRWGTGDAEREIFQILKTAILERRVLAFTYYNTSGVCSGRRVEPMKLRFQSNSWYLQAFCLTREDFRTFKTCRMDRLHLLDETFNRRESPPEPAGDWGPPEEYTALKLRFSARVAYRVRDEFDRSQITAGEDGCLLVSTWYPVEDWIVGFLLSFGDDVEVLSPPSMRSRLRGLAEQVAKKYCDDSLKYDALVSYPAW